MTYHQKRNITDILKPGAKLKARKLTKNQIRLLEKTIEAQEKIPTPIRYPYA